MLIARHTLIHFEDAPAADLLRNHLQAKKGTR